MKTRAYRCFINHRSASYHQWNSSRTG